ncbi:MAG: hypothetical protein AAGJ37_07960 [Pseudomonadota bacterium]
MMLGIESPFILLNLIIGLPLLVLFLKVHTILLVVKSGHQAMPTSIFCVVFIALYFVFFWIFSNVIKLSADAMSEISLVQVLLASIPTTVLLYIIFEAVNKLFGKNEIEN